MSLPKQIQVAIFFWVSLIYILTLLRVAHLGLNAKFLLILTYNKKAPQPKRGKGAEQLYDEANTEMYLSCLHVTNVLCNFY